MLKSVIANYLTNASTIEKEITTLFLNSYKSQQKNRKQIVNRGKIDTPNTHIHDPLTFLGWYRHFNYKVTGLN